MGSLFLSSPGYDAVIPSINTFLPWRIGSSTYYLGACFHQKMIVLCATLIAEPFFIQKVDIVADTVIFISQIMGALAVVAIGVTLLAIALGKIRV